MSRDFDRFMVHVDIGTDEKLAGLSDPERLCHIAGVLAIAAKAPIRGCLLVGETEAQPRHIAKRADVTERVAKGTLAKLKEVGVLVRDEDLGCWRVHNWAKFNPDPKRDVTAAERQQRRRDRVRSGRDVTAPSRRDTRDGHASVTPPEVEVRREGKEEVPPDPPRGNRDRDRFEYELKYNAFAAEHFPGSRPQLVKHCEELQRARGMEPTVESLRPWVENGGVPPSKEAA